ncbi:MAG: hypothetical protein DDT19_00889 [Syntrophomonadaceae bacterium]|nr:hypothetical protein [Bacillota bacterium]
MTIPHTGNIGIVGIVTVTVTIAPQASQALAAIPPTTTWWSAEGVGENTGTTLPIGMGVHVIA